MDQSIQYNLRNPAMVEDIGYSMINQMYPTMSTDMPYAGGVPTLPGTQINPGQPTRDTFKPSKAQRESNFISKVLLLGAVALGGLFIYKKSGKIAGKIVDLAKKLGSKVVNTGKNIGSKIKAKFKK